MDRYWQKVCIGGEVTRRQLVELVDLIGELDPDDMSELLGDLIDLRASSTCYEEELRTVAVEPTEWWFELSESNASDLDGLSRYCIDNKLCWEVQNDAKYDLNSGLWWWQPGMESPRWSPFEMDVGQTFRLSWIEDMLAERPEALLSEFLAMYEAPVVPLLRVRGDESKEVADE